MTTATTSIRVWDLPTRLFHWLLVGLMGFSWWSAETGAMDWHRLSGSVLLGLIAFRVIWGFAGGSTARFRTFLRSPMQVIAYMRSTSPERRKPGHNPIGGYSVALMLLLVLLQIITGLFAVDVDGLESGQLSHLVSFDQGRLAAEIHEISFTLLQIVVAIHVLAILFYLVVRKRNLIRPMVTGADSQIEDARDALNPASPMRLVVALVISAALAWWAVKGFPL
jgi:cytochrome b